MLRWLVFCVLLCPVLGACSSCDDERNNPTDAGVAQMAPVPEPAGVVAKLVVPTPDRTLAEMRAASGGPTLFVPRSVGGLAANLFGLPLQAAEHFDEHLPIVGASILGAEEAHFAVAFRVTETSRVLAASTLGADAPFQTERDGEMAFLEPTGKALRRPMWAVAMGFLDNYLLVGDSREGLRKLGPYLTRTLAREEPPPGDVVLDLSDGALRGPLRERLQSLRPDASLSFVPEHLRPLLDLQSMLGGALDIAGKLGGGRVTLKILESTLELRAELGTTDDAMFSLPTASPKDLARLPDDAVVAMTWAESEAGRVEAMRGRVAELGKLLGEGWTEEDRSALAAALDDVARGRGDRTTMGLRCTGIGLTGLAMGDAADGKRLAAALDRLVELRGHVSVKKKLDEAKLELTAARARILEVPDPMWRVRILPIAPPGAVAEEIDFLIQVRASEFLAAAGMETVGTMQHLHAPEEAQSLATRGPVVEALGAVGEPAWLTAMIDPQAIQACRMGKPGGAASAPIVLAVGPAADRRVRVEIVAARALLSVLVKELL